MKHRSLTDRLYDLINIAFLILIATAMILPFLYIFSVSFSSMEDYLQSDFLIWPKHWQLDAYRYILNSHTFVRAGIVTVGIAVVGTLCGLLFTSAMAFGLTRPIPGRRVVLFGVLFTMLFSGGMIPSYLMVKATGLLNTYWALIIPGLIGPFALIIMRQFIMSIGAELIEAAVIDGANEMQIYWRIAIPLSKPVLAAFGLFGAVGHWNSWFGAILYLNDSRMWTIQVVLRQIVVLSQPALLGDQIMPEEPPPPETIQMAAIMLATAPILFVYPFLQKHFTKGVMLGAIKG
jgi:putative aldouronate transport system permease protein